MSIQDYLIILSASLLTGLFLGGLAYAVRYRPPVPVTRRADLAECLSRMGPAANRAAESMRAMQAPLERVGTAMHQLVEAFNSPYQPTDRQKGDPQ